MKPWTWIRKLGPNRPRNGTQATGLNQFDSPKGQKKVPFKCMWERRAGASITIMHLNGEGDIQKCWLTFSS